MTFQKHVNGVRMRAVALGIAWRYESLWPLHVSQTYIEEGGVMPLGYGYAWRDWLTDNWICLPVPLNVIAHYGRRFYHWMLTRRTPSALDAAFHAGYKHGRYADSTFGDADYNAAFEAGRQRERREQVQ